MTAQQSVESLCSNVCPPALSSDALREDYENLNSGHLILPGKSGAGEIWLSGIEWARNF